MPLGTGTKVPSKSQRLLSDVYRVNGLNVTLSQGKIHWCVCVQCSGLIWGVVVFSCLIMYTNCVNQQGNSTVVCSVQEADGANCLLFVCLTGCHQLYNTGARSSESIRRHNYNLRDLIKNEISVF